MSVIVLLALPVAAAALSCLPGRRLGSTVTLISSVAVLVVSAMIARQVVSTGPVATLPGWVSVDGLSALVLLQIAFVGATAAFFSWGYMSADSHAPGRLRLYHANYNLFVFSMLAIPVLVEPTLVWIVVELTTLCSALLVSFENTREAMEAAWKYIVLSLMGAAVALLGFLVLFAAMQAAGGGRYTWEGLVAAAPRMPSVLLQTAFVLILVGLGTKVGLVPMHTWLPDAHSQAPSPVCALLSGVETMTVLYVILRLFPVLKAAPASHVEAWATVFGLISVGVAAFLLLQVRDYKRMFAFSTIEHMGIILLAAGFNTFSSHYGAMYQAMNHAVTKSFCFFAAGAALLATRTRQIASVRGLIRTSPVAGASLLWGGLAIAGAPPFAVFLSEFAILKAGLSEGRYWAIGLLVLFIALGFFGILLHVNRMVFGRGAGTSEMHNVNPEGEAGPLTPFSAVRLPPICVATLIGTGLLVVALGVYLPESLHRLLQLGATALGKQ
jgi:hydrogenase-4 component F